MSRAQTKPKHGRDASSSKPKGQDAARPGAGARGEPGKAELGKGSREEARPRQGAQADDVVRDRDAGLRPQGGRTLRVVLPDDADGQEAATREAPPSRADAPTAKPGSRGAEPAGGGEPAPPSARGARPQGDGGARRAEATRSLRSVGFDADDAGPRGEA